MFVRMHACTQDIFAGTCGGISVTLVGHPFDTIKVRLQTQPMDKPIYCEQQAGRHMLVPWAQSHSQQHAGHTAMAFAVAVPAGAFR